MAKLKKADLPEHFFKRLSFDDRPVVTKACNHAGCSGVGEFRAPRHHKIDDSNPLTTSGGVRDYYWFCLDHVKAYNEQWDFYEGLSVPEMESAIRSDAQWNRPSWPLGQATLKSVLKNKREKKWMGDMGDHTQNHQQEAPKQFVHVKAELEALALFELQPPTDFAEIKKRYRKMVKRHHPDVQTSKAAMREAEEKIKNFNVAFTLLKEMYGKG